MTGLKGLNLALRFALELAMFAALAYGGWRWAAAVSSARVWPVIAAAVLAVAAMVVWGLFLSPKASVPLPVAAALVVEGDLFVAAALALLLVGHPLSAVGLVAVWALNRILLAVWRQTDAGSRRPGD